MTTQAKTLLSGHSSPETAYVVADYPYGFKLRCSIRYWLEYHDKRGVRFMSQTTNPKKGNVWNKPKSSTYANVDAAMYLDENGHVQWSAITEYTNAKDALAHVLAFGGSVGSLCWAKRKVSAYAMLADGTMRMSVTVNGVRQEESDETKAAERARDAEEANAWREVVKAFGEVVQM